MTLKPSEFPRGKNPQATHVSDDVTTTTDTEEEASQVVGDGIHAGVSVLIIGTASVTSGANTSDIHIELYEDTLGGTTVGEAIDETVATPGDSQIVTCIAIAQAYQTNPVYVLGITTTSATANSTINNSCIAVIPIGG